MPVPYDQRRRRREQLAAELLPDLRKWVALRHVETVAKFSPETQLRLAEAIKAGVSAPAAVRFLKEKPESGVDQIVRLAGKRKQTAKKGTQRSPGSDDLILLADLLQTCFPDMPQATAHAMAGSDLLSEILDVICAQQVCLASSHARSDFFIVVFCGLALETIEGLNRIILTKTIYRQALQQSGLEWPY